MNMKKIFSRRNIYIGLFSILYGVVALVSLIHSFSFFGLANNPSMAIMLGTAFEIGQAAVLFAILTSSKDRNRVMPWALMILLTLVQIIGNVFSSYKYLMLNNVNDLKYFKEPIFIWTTLPDNVTTVIVTYIVGAILPIVALCMTAMITNYLEDNKIEDNKIDNNTNDNTNDDDTVEDYTIEDDKTIDNEIPKDVLPENIEQDENEQDKNEEQMESHFINL